MKESSKLVSVISIIGFLIWAGNKPTMESLIGDKVLYPLFIIALILSLINKTEEKGRFLTIIGLSGYLILWVTRKLGLGL